MKKAVALVVMVTAILCFTSPKVSADETVFSGNFNSITFYVGLGSYEKLLNGISATDPYTKEDITDKVGILGTIDFDKVGVYNVSYSVVDSAGKTWGELRKVSIVELDSDVEYVNIDHGRNYLESIDFEMIKNTDFELRYFLYSDNYEKLLYSWAFSGENIYNPPRRMSVTITGESQYYDAIKAGVGQANFQILNFEYKDRFPSEAEIFFAVDESFDKDSTLYLYSYGEIEGFKLIADGITINDVNYASYGFSKGGEYVLTDKKVGYSHSTNTQYSSTHSEIVPEKIPSENISGDYISPEFNAEASKDDNESEALSDTQRYIFFGVIALAGVIVLLALAVFIVTSRKQNKKEK